MSALPDFGDDLGPAKVIHIRQPAIGLRALLVVDNVARGPAIGGLRMPLADKERLIRAFAHALRNESDYIFGPDMGTDEGCMAWIKDETGRAAGLPVELGGIPLDEYGATGWGLAHSALAAVPFAGLKLEGARVAVQGYGAVGRHAAQFLAAREVRKAMGRRRFGSL